MGDALKPCPFDHDGADVGLTGDGVLHWGCCRICGTYGPSGATEEHAIAAWNRRAPSPLPSVEAIRHAIRVNIPSATDAHGVTDAARAVLALIGGE